MRRRRAPPCSEMATREEGGTKERAEGARTRTSEGSWGRDGWWDSARGSRSFAGSPRWKSNEP